MSSMPNNAGGVYDERCYSAVALICEVDVTLGAAAPPRAGLFIRTYILDIPTAIDDSSTAVGRNKVDQQR
jgi:hypothetical protein